MELKHWTWNGSHRNGFARVAWEALLQMPAKGQSTKPVLYFCVKKKKNHIWDQTPYILKDFPASDEFKYALLAARH